MEFKKVAIITFSCIFAIVLWYAGSASFPLAFADETYSFVTEWGSLGNYDGMLNVPASIDS